MTKLVVNITRAFLYPLVFAEGVIEIECLCLSDSIQSGFSACTDFSN